MIKSGLATDVEAASIKKSIFPLNFSGFSVFLSTTRYKAMDGLVIKAVIELILAVVLIMSTVSAGSFFTGQLFPKVRALEHREQELYKTTTNSLGALEQKVSTLRDQTFSLQGEIAGLRLCFQ